MRKLKKQYVLCVAFFVIAVVGLFVYLLVHNTQKYNEVEVVFLSDPQFKTINTLGKSPVVSSSDSDLTRILKEYSVEKYKLINNPSADLDYSINGSNESVLRQTELPYVYRLYSKANVENLEFAIGARGSQIAGGSEYEVVPVIFFPTNYPVEAAVVDHVNKVMADIQQWYGWWNEGKTFTLKPAVVVAGDHDSYWYWCADNEQGCVEKNIFENLNRELNRKGVGYLNPNKPYTAYPTIIMGGGGIGGAMGFDWTGGGAAANIGDLSIYPELDGNCNRVKQFYFKGDPVDSMARCLNERMTTTRQGSGALAHEIGHVFDLPHTEALGYSLNSFEAQNSLMQNHGIFPNTILAPREKQILANKQYLNTTIASSECSANLNVCAKSCAGGKEVLSGYAACTKTSGNGFKCCVKPTSSNTPRPTKSPTLTPTIPIGGVSQTPSPTKTPTPVPTATPIPTNVSTLTPTRTPTPNPQASVTLTATPTNGIACDPDGSSGITLADLRLARREIAGLEITNNASCITGGSATTLADLRKIRRILAGLDNL